MKDGAPRSASTGRHQQEPASDGLFTKLADLFLGAADPDKERRRLLKQSGRALRKLGVHYFNPKTEQADTGLAKTFYELYRSLAAGQRILSNARNSAVLRSIVVDSTLGKEQLALKEGLSEESLRKRAQHTSFQQLRTEAHNEMSSLFAGFDINKTKQINDTYASVSVLLDLILFDYYYFLRKFDPQISESRRDYVPRFRPTNCQYVSEELEQFLEILTAIDLGQDWGQILQILKSYRGVEAVPRDAWRRVSHLIRRLQNTRELELAAQLFTRNPFYKPKPRVYRDNVVEDFLSRFKLQTEATVQKLAKERKANKLQALLTQLFGSRSYLRLKNLTEETNGQLSQKLLGGFGYVLPMNCLHSFLADYLESDLGRSVEFLLIPAKWADNSHSRVVSDAFHHLQGLAHEVTALDSSLSQEQELGRRLASLVSRARENPQAQNLARQIIEKVNAQSNALLLRASQQSVALGKVLKLIIDDTETNNSQLILNWRELVSRANRDARQRFISSYKLLYYLVQLIKLYV
ncbi:MAG: hypothetical protein JW820_12175 [Spirochaetales bacterium]|nr:hypothetical protein [Spirochaetales bacterium]